MLLKDARRAGLSENRNARPGTRSAPSRDPGARLFWLNLGRVLDDQDPLWCSWRICTYSPGLSRRVRDLQKKLCRSANPRGAFVQASARRLAPRQDVPRPIVVPINTSTVDDRNKKLRYNATKSCDVSERCPRLLDAASAGFFAVSASPCSRPSGYAAPSATRRAGLVDGGGRSREGDGVRTRAGAGRGSRWAREQGVSPAGLVVPATPSPREEPCRPDGLRRSILRCHESAHGARRSRRRQSIDSIDALIWL